MKKYLIALSFTLMTLNSFASNAPLLRDLNLGTYSGRDFFTQCNLTLEENSDGNIVAIFSKGGLIFKSRPANSASTVMVSSNQQVWVDFQIEGMIHVNLMLNNENDLRPISYEILEGRTNKIFKCKSLQ